MKIIDQLKEMKAGESKPFNAKHPKEARSIRAMCSYATNYFPELNMRFTTEFFRDRNIIVVTAVSKEK